MSLNLATSSIQFSHLKNLALTILQTAPFAPKNEALNNIYPAFQDYKDQRARSEYAVALTSLQTNLKALDLNSDAKQHGFPDDLRDLLIQGSDRLVSHLSRYLSVDRAKLSSIENIEHPANRLAAACEYLAFHLDLEQQKYFRAHPKVPRTAAQSKEIELFAQMDAAERQIMQQNNNPLPNFPSALAWPRPKQVS